MSLELPEPIAAYFAGQNNHDIHAMLALFAAAAIVKDEGQERRGLAAIQEWMAETTRKHRPVELRFTFTLAGDKISRLEILS